MKPGDVIFWANDTPEGADDARAFCKSRGLSQDQARLVRREAPTLGRVMIMVEIKATCSLKVE